MCVKGLPAATETSGTPAPCCAKVPSQPRHQGHLPDDLPSGRNRLWELWPEVSSGPTRSCVSAGPASASWGCAATRSSRGSKAPMPPTQFTTSWGWGAGSERATPRHFFFFFFF